MQKILVVDDELDCRTVLAIYLESRGYQVECADSGAEALSIFESHPPDLVISDVMMPHMDGFEFCRRLRSTRLGQLVPFIFLSGQGELESKIEGHSIGADDYLVKPFEPRELLAKVQGQLERSHRIHAEIVRLLQNSVFEQVKVPTPTATPKPKPLPLTPAEERVFWEVIQGFTNKQISDRLFISPRTVQAHLSSIFSKLQLENRTHNLGISVAAGSTVVLVRPEAMPPRQPIASRLAEVVHEPGVAVAQPLVVDLDGVILSAGARFSPDNPHPELFLAGLPSSDAVRIGRCDVASAASPLVALRTEDAVSLRGLDARFHSVLAETDLGLRARRAGLGGSVVVPDTVVTSRTPYAGAEELIGAMSSLRRGTAAPPPDRARDLLLTAGLEVTDQRNRRITADAEDRTSLSVLVPELVVRAVQGIHETPPRLRWAIDIAAPAASRGDRWGDTYFARSLADALERRGQHVAIDRRDARERDSRDHDDVLLVLRGLDRVIPRPGLLNVEWIISHPDMISPDEVAGFDLVYAASTSWSERMTREWGTVIAPLLQCTDTRWFHPDRAEPDTGPELLFVGNSRGVYRYAVRSALAVGADLTLHGNDWTEFVERDQIASGGVANEEVGVLYASAGVVLNDHHLDMRRDSFASNRLFDAAACGARILSDRIDGLEETFSGLVVPFDNEHELARLVTRPYDAFPDDATRREIAQRIISEHSFDKRAETLIDDAVRRLLAR